MVRGLIEGTAYEKGRNLSHGVRIRQLCTRPAILRDRVSQDGEVAFQTQEGRHARIRYQGVAYMNPKKFDTLVRSLGIKKGDAVEIWLASGWITCQGRGYPLSMKRKEFHVGTTYQGHDKVRVFHSNGKAYYLLSNVVRFDIDHREKESLPVV